MHLPCQLPWWLTAQVSTSNWSQAARKTQKVSKGNPPFKSSDYILEADSVALSPGLAAHPADLNQSGNLHRHLSKPEQTLKKNGLLRSLGGKQTEPPVGDVLHSSTEHLCFFSGRKRRQLASLEFSPDRIARILSFCPRLLRITPRKDLQTHHGHKGFRTLRTFKAGGRCLAAIFQSCSIFARIPARLEAPVLNITDRKKAFAVLGLMSIRLAICLVVHPCIRNSRASFSRSVR